MTFNLRYDKPDPGNNAWRVRRQAVAAIISQSAPDVIGTQEGKAHQLLDLHRLLPDYQSVGGDRAGNGTDERCAIFYRQERLSCLEAGDFWLSNTPDIPGSISQDWGNPLPRMVSWAIFAIRGEAKKVVIFNTHLDYQSDRARELSAHSICDRLGTLNVTDSLLFLTGDFNDHPGTVARQSFLNPLTNGVQLLDALAGVEFHRQLTFHDFTGKAFAAIDTIYYDSRITQLRIKVEASQCQGIWPSDHFPVLAEFEI